MSDPIFLTLGGESYELRPDFACLSALEDAFGQPLLEIAEIFIDETPPLKLMVEALAIILAWPADPASRTTLGDEIVATGVGEVLQKLQKFFLIALGLGKKNETDAA